MYSCLTKARKTESLYYGRTVIAKTAGAGFQKFMGSRLGRKWTTKMLMLAIRARSRLFPDIVL